MMKKRMTERKKGWLILSLSLDAFAGLGLEVLLAFWLEPMIYGRTMEQWNTWQSVLHWCITCIIWGSVAGYLLWSADKNYGLKLIKRDGDGTESLRSVKLWQWGLVIAGSACKIITSVMDWGGFKVYMEWKSRGPLLFLFQYIYYMFETALFTLILVFAQIAFETWFKNTILC